jgi:anaerobic selenocysteine-containing dehydrogenase
MREAKSFCRICGAFCGVKLTLDDNDRIVDIRGDRDHPMTRGYACFKGLQAENAHHGPERLLHPLKRLPDGRFEQIPFEQALDEIAARLQSIRGQYGPGSIAGFNGSGSVMNVTAGIMLPLFMRALGSPAYFSTNTVDQSAKYVTRARLGAWSAGRPGLEESDVVMIVGSNPLVSHSLPGCLTADPTKRIKEAKQRGVKFIVIDPRRTETARHADVFLQPYPGEDVSIAAGLLRLILANGWHDADFCARFVKPQGLVDLRRAVEPFTPDYVAHRAGIAAEKLVAAAEMFARDNAHGSVFFATGPSMAPHSNLADHLLTCINVVCGRYRRAGDPVSDVVTWRPLPEYREQVIGPGRSYERSGPSRIRGARVAFGEMMACNFADEILTPGEGQIRAVLNGSCNIAVALPKQQKTVRALQALELLVSIEPYMTPTARLSHYIIPPKLQYERADLPVGSSVLCYTPEPLGAYTPEILRTPPGSEVVDDWSVYWGLARRLGVQIVFGGRKLDMVNQPTTDQLIEILTDGAAVPLAELKRHPGGKVFDLGVKVVPGRPDATGRFDVMPEDIAAELAEVAAEQAVPDGVVVQGQRFSHRLSVRRSRNVWNTMNHLAPFRAKYPYNPAWVNPGDLAALGLRDGDKAEIVSAHGRIPAILAADAGMRPGVIAISHGWGGLPEGGGAYEQGGSNTNLLVGDRHEPINAMAHLSAIPVNIEPWRHNSGAPHES